MNSSFWVVWFVLLLCVIIPVTKRKKLYLNLINRKRRGENRMMPTELMKEFIGKVCSITLFNESFGITGRIETLEGNWIKVKEKETVRLVNGDMIRDIKILPEKYQK